MNDFTWTKGTPHFRDPIEWWRTRLDKDQPPFVVAVELQVDGSRIVSFPGRADTVDATGLPVDALWGGRIDMGELPESVDVRAPAVPVPPPGWEFDPDCDTTSTGEMWTAQTWAWRWPSSMCNNHHLHDGGSVDPWTQEFAGVDGIPVWRSVSDEWWRIETNEGRERFSRSSIPVGPLIPIRRVRS